MNKKSIASTYRSAALMALIVMAVYGFVGCKPTVTVKGSEITPDTALAADKFTRHTVTGIRTPLPQAPDVPGLIGVSYLTIGDINKDGIKEIVATSGIGQDKDQSTANGDVALYTWNGQDMDNWTQSIISSDFAFPNETVLRDIDGDGNIDIMVMDNFIFCLHQGGIYYLRNKGGDNITSPSNWEKKTIYTKGGTDMVSLASYHKAVFIDLDGDGLEDFVTSKVSYCLYTQNDGSQYNWIEWFKNEGNGSFSGPYEIGQGAGFMFLVKDINGDGKPDIVAPQFLIADPATNEPWGTAQNPDPEGASLLWFENPGNVTTTSPAWKSHIIDYWYTSKNPIGKAMEVIAADIDKDNKTELLVSSHNHQNYLDAPANTVRYWPSGVFAFEIPRNPKKTSAWKSVVIDSGDPNLDPNDATAVANDPFAVNRPGGAMAQGSPGMVRAADINGDGFADIVLPGDGKGIVYYYESQGVANGIVKYKRTALYEDPKCMPGDAQIVDIDGDGKLEIVSAIYDTSVNKNSDSGSIFIFKQK